MRSDIEKIINYGILAPSGDNSQPWKFEVRDNSIHIYSYPERDTSVYNSREASIHVAHGALIENIIVASKNLGYSPEVSLFPDDNNPLLTTTIKLVKSSKLDPQEDLPLETLENRCTNRKKYLDQKINNETKEDIEACASQVGYGRIHLEEDFDKIKKLSKPLSYNEKFALETKEIHQFLFHHLTWTKEEQMEKRVGMGVGTLELNFPANLIFKLLRFWPVMNLLNKLVGASNLVAQENERIFSHSSLIGTIISKSDSREDMIMTGRLLQRIWLKSAKHNLAMQLLTGIGFFHFKVKHNDPEPFNQKQVSLIEESYDKIANIINLNKGHEIFLISFRLGYAPEPTERCYRLPPEIDWL